jgi:adenine-specific DNA-methyltransferase
MNKYPTINYIGNKQKIVDWIIEKFPIKNGTVVDLFSGGASVSYGLKKKGFRVLSNDFLYSNYVLAKALIENSADILDFRKIEYKPKLSDIEKKYSEINFLSDVLYFDFEIKELAKLLLVSENVKEYEKSIFLALLRRAMIRKIPYSRMNIRWDQIKKFRDEEYSYKKYKRRRAYHNKSFFYHIEDYLDQYNKAVFDNGKENMAFQKDAYVFLEELNENVDLIYMDPPYPSTMNDYESFYGYFDQILGKKIETYSKLTDKLTFMEEFEKLVKLACETSNFVALSINNRAKPSYLEISKMVSKYGLVSIHEKNHVYKVTGKENKNKSIEYLIVIDTKKIRS